MSMSRTNQSQYNQQDLGQPSHNPSNYLQQMPPPPPPPPQPPTNVIQRSNSLASTRSIHESGNFSPPQTPKPVEMYDWNRQANYDVPPYQYSQPPGIIIFHEV